MKKVVQTNIGGRHFFMDEDAYQVMNEYLDSLKAHFEKEKEVANEIIGDIEHRMAELLESRITDSKKVISLEDVLETIKILGKIEDFEFMDSTGQYKEEKAEDEEEPSYSRKENRRLYRDPDNSYIAGIGGGIGAYFNIDPLWPRLVLFALIFANGFGIILYLILWVVIPKATSTAQKLQMKGEPVTVRNIEKSISDEYQKVKKNIHKIRDSEKFHRTQDVFYEILHGIGLFIKAILKIIVYVIGIALIVAGVALVAGLGIAFFTKLDVFGNIEWPRFDLSELSNIFIDPVHFNLMTLCLAILILVPLIALIYGGIKLVFNIRTRNRFLRAIGLTAWILALICLVTLTFFEGENYAFEASQSSKHAITDNNYSTLYLDIRQDYDYIEGMTVYSIFDFDIYYSKSGEKIMGKPELEIIKGYDDSPSLTIKKYSRNVSMKNGNSYLDEIEYKWNQEDSIIYFDQFFSLDKDDKWRFPQVELTLSIPENKAIYLSEGMQDIIGDINSIDFYTIDDMIDKKWIMTDRGLKLYSSNVE
jgi:phage shock protein PspC (stress-responsive transcriptional regulator)